MRLINKTCVITAAAQGIGRATALSFAEQGAKVIATDINLELLEQLKSHSDNIQVEYLDITNPQQIIEFSKKAIFSPSQVLLFLQMQNQAYKYISRRFLL